MQAGLLLRKNSWVGDLYGGFFWSFYMQARSQEFFVGGGRGRATLRIRGGGVVDEVSKFEGG